MAGYNFNLDATIEALGGDRETLEILLETFKKNLPGRLANIEAALKTGNAADLRAVAHSLKGSVSYFHVPELTEKAGKLEKMGADNKLEGAEAFFREMAEELTAFVSEVEKKLAGT